MANKSRDTHDLDAIVAPVLETVGHRELSARSVLLSYLLGLPGFSVPTHHLVEIGALFGLRPGTVRTALSRMVTASEITASPDGYRVAGAMLERQSQQERGLALSEPEPGAWDGTWWTALVIDAARPMSDRRRFRSAMVGALMGELRPEVWMRPADVSAPPSLPAVAITRGPVDGIDDRELADRLWDIDASEATARRLTEAVDAVDESISEREPAEWFRPSFELSAACVRFLRTEPALPPTLVATPAAAELRSGYRRFNTHFRTALGFGLTGPPRT